MNSSKSKRRELETRERLSLYRQEALSSAISEKDAHLAWLEVTGDGNIHTKESIERLRRERRELLNRMKEEVRGRCKMIGNISSVYRMRTDQSSSAAWWGTLALC